MTTTADLIENTVGSLEPLVRASAVARQVADIDGTVDRELDQMRATLRSQIEHADVTWNGELAAEKIADNFRITYEVAYADHDPAGRTAVEILAAEQARVDAEYEST